MTLGGLMSCEKSPFSPCIYYFFLIQ